MGPTTSSTSTSASDRMVTLGACLIAISVGFIALAIIAGEREYRRPWFALRMAVAATLLPGMAFLAVEADRLGLVSRQAEPVMSVLLLGLGVPALLIFAPGLLYWPRPESGGGDGGGGRGPDRPPPPEPVGPRDGVPLPDALPARIRLRDHAAPDWRGRRTRQRPAPRPAPERPAPHRVARRQVRAGALAGPRLDQAAGRRHHP